MDKFKDILLQRFPWITQTSAHRISIGSGIRAFQADSVSFNRMPQLHITMPAVFTSFRVKLVRDSATILRFSDAFHCFFKQCPVYNCCMMIFQANPFCFIIQNCFMGGMHTTCFAILVQYKSHPGQLPLLSRSTQVFLFDCIKPLELPDPLLDNFCSSQSGNRLSVQSPCNICKTCSFRCI